MMLEHDDLERQTATVPVTTMEELPVLSDAERAGLMQSLADAEARIAAGHFVEYEPRSFKARLEKVYRAAKRTKGA